MEKLDLHLTPEQQAIHNLLERVNRLEVAVLFPIQSTRNEIPIPIVDLSQPIGGPLNKRRLPMSIEEAIVAGFVKPENVVAPHPDFIGDKGAVTQFCPICVANAKREATRLPWSRTGVKIDFRIHRVVWKSGAGIILGESRVNAIGRDFVEFVPPAPPRFFQDGGFSEHDTCEQITPPGDGLVEVVVRDPE